MGGKRAVDSGLLGILDFLTLSHIRGLKCFYGGVTGPAQIDRFFIALLSASSASIVVCTSAGFWLKLAHRHPAILGVCWVSESSAENHAQQPLFLVREEFPARNEQHRRLSRPGTHRG